MNTNVHSATIFDLIKPSGWVREIPMLIVFNLILIGCAQISINLPWVPITGQTFGVLLIAMALGRVRGTAVVMAYLIEGAAGLPVFAEGRAGLGVILGPTGGYLVGFALAAWAVGWLADHGWDRLYFRSGVAMLLGTVIIFVCGIAWLTMYVPSELLLQIGLIPFIPGAIVKIVLAATVLPSIWKLVGRKSDPA